jgi:GNAT superfamily N-acetyltransferase
MPEIATDPAPAPREAFDAAWARCGPWLQAALDEAPLAYTLDDVRKLVRAGEAQLWVFERSAAVTRVFDEPRARVLNHWLVGGDLEELTHMQPHVEAWARTRGCTRLMLGGRRGWARVLEPHGFSMAGVVLTKELR